MTIAGVAENGRELEHASRVAAWCAEIGLALDLPAEDRRVLEQAALAHQRSKLVVDAEAWSAMRFQLGIAESQVTPDREYDQVLEVLRTLHGRRPASPQVRVLATIIEQCDDLDSAWELNTMVSGDPDVCGLEGVAAEVTTYLGAAAEPDFLVAQNKVGVFPSVAHRAMAVLADENMNVGDLASIVDSDQTLAGHIIAAANSATLGSLNPAVSLRQALVRIGSKMARQIVLAASLRSVFGARHSYALWNHSLDVAESAARMAAQSKSVHGEQAFLAGLVHDLGKLVMLNLPVPSVKRHARLTGAGCPSLLVEQVVFGHTHAAAGADLLRKWQFDETIVSAVEHHHEPERSALPLCSLLYLVESATSPREASASEWRTELARGNAAIRSGAERAIAITASPLTGLRFAAAA